MIILLGVGGSKVVHGFAKEHNCGWLMTPFNNRTPPKNLPYAIDNGKFSIYLNELEGKKRNRPKDWKPLEWNPDKFRRLIKKYPDYIFVAAPDIVCPPDPMDSINLSMEWVDELESPVYLVVQDNMTEMMVRKVLDNFAGIFVGGSVPWKQSTMRMWCDLAHLHNLKCHIGQITHCDTMIAAHFCGADSIDTSAFTRHQNDSEIRMYKEALKTQTLLIHGYEEPHWKPVRREEFRSCSKP